jgi:hypothetical protein
MEKQNMEKRKNILNILFSTLLFGGLWGILEATLGSLLHMPFVHSTMFLASTTIMVPIAYFLMGACYKRTNSYRSVFYMGILAGGIKLLACAIFHMSFNPVYYILMESLFMGLALLVIRPKNVISFAGLGTMILANTLYLGVSTFVRVSVMTATQSVFVENFIKYTFTLNAIAILYTFAVGAIIFGVIKLKEKYNWNFSKIESVIYHPAFASSVAAVALVLTVVIH